jgi:hypothetical protein
MRQFTVPSYRLALALLLAGFVLSPGQTRAQEHDRQRLIVITDIGTEPDDIESMVRLLTYANEIEIEGLIASTSRHLASRTHPELIEQRVDAYGEVLGNLRVHDPRYPDADELRARIRSWRPEYGMSGVGDGRGNAASQLIIDAVDRDDPRPVWVSVWGGAAPLAQALWTVRATRSPEEVDRFVSRLRVYTISDQDDAGPWARTNFPRLFWISSIHGFGNYQLSTWVGISSAQPGADPAPISRRWLRDNIQHGPLGSLYPLPIFIMEGDTPSFLNLIDNGLSQPEHPDWGGWGGRWEQPSAEFGLWADALDLVVGIDGREYHTNQATIWRWREAFQHDFAARIQWSVTPEFGDANHAPQLVVNGVGGTLPLTVQACPGQPVALSAVGSVDPDGDSLTYRWWRYTDMGGFWKPGLTLADSDSVEAKVTVDPWVQPFEFPLNDFQRFHIILEVRDQGTPALTRYRRVLLDVATDGRTIDGRACPAIEMQPPPADVHFVTEAVADNGARWSTGVSTIGELRANPSALAILERRLPAYVFEGLVNPVTQNMTLSALKAFAPELTDEMLSLIDAELAQLP